MTDSARPSPTHADQPALWQLALAVAWPVVVLLAFLATAFVPALERLLGGP